MQFKQELFWKLIIAVFYDVASDLKSHSFLKLVSSIPRTVNPLKHNSSQYATCFNSKTSEIPSL